MDNVINLEESLQFKLQARITELESQLTQKTEQYQKLKREINMTTSVNELLRLQLQETISTLNQFKAQIDVIMNNINLLSSKLPNLTKQ